MPISYDKNIIFQDECSIQECDSLLEAVQSDPKMIIDMRNCRSVHTALFQVLVAAGARPIWAPLDANLRELLGARLAWSEPGVELPPNARKSAARSKKESK